MGVDEKQTESPQSAEQPKRASTARMVIGYGLRAIAAVVIVAGGVGIVQWMRSTAPEPERREPGRQARLVEVLVAQSADHRIRIEAQGSVMPAKDVALTPQVSGEVVQLSDSLQPGGYFAAGDLLLEIDSSDYELAVRERESMVTQMRSALTLERASQDVAKREFEMLGEEIPAEEMSLVLREPQIASADAQLAAARAALENAKLDLERTRIAAPFDALVMQESVDLGARLTPSSMIARLIGTEQYWVEVAVPQSDLRWLKTAEDGEGSYVRVTQPKVWGENAHRDGHVIRLLPELTDSGRMARLLVGVEDPMALEPGNEGLPKLLIGQYITAMVEGEELSGVFELSRKYLRDGDYVWVMNDENELEIRSVDIAYRGLDNVLIADGLNDGDRVVTSNIPTPSEGMPLRVPDDGQSPAEETR